MAHLKNWSPGLNADERRWFDVCPKALLFAIAQQFAMRLAAEPTAEAAFELMQEEWTALHANGLCPQKPFNAGRPMNRRAE